MKEGIFEIKDFRVGMNVRGFYLCRYVENKVTRLGDQYLDLMLEDNSGTIRAKLWSFSDNFENNFKDGDPVAVKGTIIKYNNSNEINVSYINFADKSIYAKYGFKPNKLIKKVDFDISHLTDILNKSVNQIESKFGKIVKIIIKDNIKKMKLIPSLSFSYDLSGGYLLEIIDLLKLNSSIIDNYPEINKDIVLCGLILKNIGLLKYFNNDLRLSKNEEFIGVDLRLISLNIINDYFSDESYDNIKFILQNIILSAYDAEDVNVRYVNSLYRFNQSVKKYKI